MEAVIININYEYTTFSQLTSYGLRWIWKTSIHQRFNCPYSQYMPIIHEIDNLVESFAVNIQSMLKIQDEISQIINVSLGKNNI